MNLLFFGSSVVIVAFVLRFLVALHKVDLQFGQATETLQGSAVNELRPQVYRPVFQVYGTYIFPLGNCLTVDFGKWASAMGIDNNYTKDQINYSLSYLFNFLPFYHMGVRATYQFNNFVTVTYAVVNGTQQTEDFNGFKSQMMFLDASPCEDGELEHQLSQWSGAAGCRACVESGISWWTNAAGTAR